MDKDLDYHLDLVEDNFPVIYKWPKAAKIIFGTIIGIAALLLISLIIVIVYYQKKLSNNSSQDDNINSKTNQNPLANIDTYNFLGNIIYNLTYDIDGKIENSFKLNGYNHINGIDSINDNKDYEKNERNIYNLFIPQYAMDRMKDYNGIFLWIHGGAWISGSVDGMELLCKPTSYQGYISATMGYTLLTSDFKEFNIYKNIDEITACIKAIKNKLINLGFNGNKLYLAIGGFSAGAHLSLLYSYLNSKMDIIPLKFVVNLAGPIGLYPKYYYKVKSKNEPLSNIEDISSIEEAVKNGTVVPLYKEGFALKLMNLFSGNKFADSIYSMLFPNGTINYENEKYKEMFKITKNAFITETEDKHRIPTLCIYGGIDEVIGMTQFAYLKHKMDLDKRKYDFFYSRYEGHVLFLPHTPDGEKKLRTFFSKITQYSKKYFGY